MGEPAQEFENLGARAEAFVADAAPVLAWLRKTLGSPAGANLDRELGAAMLSMVRLVVAAGQALLPLLPEGSDEHVRVEEVASEADELVDTLSWFVEARDDLVKLARDEVCA